MSRRGKMRVNLFLAFLIYVLILPTFFSGGLFGKNGSARVRQVRMMPVIPRPPSLRRKEVPKKAPEKKPESVKKVEKPVKKPEPKKEPPKKKIVKPDPVLLKPIVFPEQRFLSFLDEVKRKEEFLTEKQELALKARLKKLLPRGKYIFNKACPILFVPPGEGNTGRGELRISCLPEELQELHAIRDFHDTEQNAWVGFPYIRVRRKLTGLLDLESISLSSGRVRWHWVGVRFEYINPYMDLLRRAFPTLPESIITKEHNLSRSLPGLFRIFARASLNKPGNLKDFQEIFQPGGRLRFEKSCPLRLREEPRLLKGDNRVRLVLQISCLPEARLSLVNLLLPPNRSNILHLLPAQGEIFYGELTYGGIFQSNGQFYLRWDTILNIRQPEKTAKSRKSPDVI